MSRKKDEEPHLAWLVKPAKDLVENFSIDVLKALTAYLELIQKAAEDDPENLDADGNYKVFDFPEACRVLTGSMAVYGKKVDHVYELVMSVIDLVENNEENEGKGGAAGRKGGRKKAQNLGSTSYELINLADIRREAMESMDKAEKEDKKAVDNLRLVDNAEINEAQYERKSIVVVKPTQFMFKLNYGQLSRTDEQIWNARARPDVIGKVKDFDIKKSDIIHEHQMLFTHDDYRHNCDQFTLPGARWMPDNKELATNFGVAEIEVELDLEQEADKVNAYGPYKDPLSGREVVAPPRWYVEQEAVRQQQEIISRAHSRAMSRAATAGTLRESQGFGSQPTRLSQPFLERKRNTLNQFVSFVEGRMNKNRPSTHLNTGLVDMFVDNFGGSQNGPFNDENDQNGMEVDCDDFDMAGGNDYDDDNRDDYVHDMSRRKERRAPAPWDDLEKSTRVSRYNGEEDLHVSRKPVKAIARDPLKPMDMLIRKNRREEKIGKSRRDEFMETHDYLQDYYYWRSAARINPNKDWKVEALRAAILKEKKRRVKEKTARIREARAQVLEPRRRTTRAGIAMENFEAVLEDEDQVPMNNRRTLGAEYEDVADDDLAAEVELSILGGGFDFDEEDDVRPRGELPPLPPPDNYDVDMPAPEMSYQNPQASVYQPLRFDDIDDAELNSVINLPGNLLIDKALPLLKKFAENRTDREQMAYEMAKAYEDVDVAVSTLQEQVDKWHSKLEPILDEGETRKEYDVHMIGRAVLQNFEVEGDTKPLVELVMGRPWYEISRYFLSCLFMCNVKNVMIGEDRELPLEERINSMTVSLLSRDMHHEVFKQGDALN